MKVEFVRGDLLVDPAQVLVNPVNCVGTMGAGLARQFATRWPDLLTPYRRHCQARELRPGRVLWYRRPDDTRRFLACFPTKDDWRNPSQHDFIVSGLRALLQGLARFRITGGVALPQLGCGLGGLSWDDDIGGLLEDVLRRAPDTHGVARLYGPVPLVRTPSEPLWSEQADVPALAEPEYHP